MAVSDAVQRQQHLKLVRCGIVLDAQNAAVPGPGLHLLNEDEAVAARLMGDGDGTNDIQFGECADHPVGPRPIRPTGDVRGVPRDTLHRHGGPVCGGADQTGSEHAQERGGDRGKTHNGILAVPAGQGGQVVPKNLLNAAGRFRLESAHNAVPIFNEGADDVKALGEVGYNGWAVAAKSTGRTGRYG